MKWYLIILIAIIIVGIITGRIKKRGFFWKDKKGNKLTLKEFFKRWGKGIEGITARQQAFTNLLGIWIIISGLIAGIIVNILVRLQNMWWWILIILVGSLIVTTTSLIGSYQRYKRIKQIDEQIKNLK